MDGDGVPRRGSQRSVKSAGAGAGSSARSSARLRWGVIGGLEPSGSDGIPLGRSVRSGKRRGVGCDAGGGAGGSVPAAAALRNLGLISIAEGSVSPLVRPSFPQDHGEFPQGGRGPSAVGASLLGRGRGKRLHRLTPPRRAHAVIGGQPYGTPRSLSTTAIAPAFRLRRMGRGGFDGGPASWRDGAVPALRPWHRFPITPPPTCPW